MENLAQVGRPRAQVDTARIDAAVKAILEMKYRLGLFEDPYRYSDEAREKATIYKPEFLEAARDVARKSIVLLKNKDNALPLAAAAKSIAVIGPLGNSKEDMIGSWSAAGDRQHAPGHRCSKGCRRARPKARASPMRKGAGYRLRRRGQDRRLCRSARAGAEIRRHHRRDGREAGT